MAVAIDQKVQVADRYKVFLRLFSVLYGINLSEKEIDVLNEFCLQEQGLINKDSRKRVAARLNMSPFSLTNYLKQLRDRNVVSSTSVNEKILVNVMPDKQTFSIVFNLNNG